MSRPTRRKPLILTLAALAVLAPAVHAQQPVPPPPGTAQSWTVPATPAPAPISREEFAQRRAALAAQLEDGVLVVMGSAETEADYLPYAQNSNFRYLTGVTEPGAALVIAKQGESVRETLFVLPRNPEREVWEGDRLGTERAQALTGIATRTEDALPALLDSLLGATPRLLTFSRPASPQPAAILTAEQQFLRNAQARNPGVEVANVALAILRLRAVKSPAELAMLRRAIYITTLAHHEVARAVEPGMNEFEIQALLEATFRRHGAERPAFSSIVGSGPNSTTLHYRAADRFMEAQDMVVVDIGASYQGYAADVTRTYPVDGRFSPEQRDIYQIVLDAQKAAEAEARPGTSMPHLSQVALGVITSGLARLGLIESPDATYDCGTAERAAQCPQYRLFYMHGLGHGIGLDVHDPDSGYPQYGGSFRVGSAFTIEPGIYVRGDVLDYLPDTPGNRRMMAAIRPATERYRHIGVRIEDDYFITESGVERITQHAPREIAEIEAMMAEESFWNRQRRPEIVEWYRGVTPR
jgi:Xaa-Pro aminopeptidase